MGYDLEMSDYHEINYQENPPELDEVERQRMIYLASARYHAYLEHLAKEQLLEELERLK